MSGVVERLTSNMHTETPWYAVWFKEYSEIHIQSAPLDEDNHVLSIHYGHSEDCPAHRDSGQTLLSCDTSICEGLRNAMSNAKLIVQLVNEKTNGGDLLINQELFNEVGV